MLRFLFFPLEFRAYSKIQIYKECAFLFSSWLLVNSADRIIRVYNSNEVLACGVDGEPEPIQKLQDLVNKYN